LQVWKVASQRVRLRMEEFGRDIDRDVGGDVAALQQPTRFGGRTGAELDQR